MKEKDLRELLKNNNYEVVNDGDKVSLFHNGKEKKPCNVVIYSIYLSKEKRVVTVTEKQLHRLAEGDNYGR